MQDWNVFVEFFFARFSNVKFHESNGMNQNKSDETKSTNYDRIDFIPTNILLRIQISRPCALRSAFFSGIDYNLRPFKWGPMFFIRYLRA